MADSPKVGSPWWAPWVDSVSTGCIRAVHPDQAGQGRERRRIPAVGALERPASSSERAFIPGDRHGVIHWSSGLAGGWFRAQCGGRRSRRRTRRGARHSPARSLGLCR